MTVNVLLFEGLTNSDLVGLLGVRERQVDEVLLSPGLVQTRVGVLPSLQHELHCLLVSSCGGHVGHFGQLPRGQRKVRSCNVSGSFTT